jgi:hypothetical protein
MISGALLLDPRRTERSRDFYRRRLTRVGPALLAWTGAYALDTAGVPRDGARAPGVLAGRLGAGHGDPAAPSAAPPRGVKEDLLRKSAFPGVWCHHL